MKILYIAYSCDPFNGSEDQIGWNIPIESLNQGNTVYVLTKEDHRDSIFTCLSNNSFGRRIEFFFVDVPKIVRVIFRGLFYSGRIICWQKRALKLARKIIKEFDIDIIHQIAPIEYRALGDYGLLDVKYVAGPIGGGFPVPYPLNYYSRRHFFSEGARKVLNAISLMSLKRSGKLDRCDYVYIVNEETFEIFREKGITIDENKWEYDIDVGISEKKIHTFDNNYQGPPSLFVPGRLTYRKGYELLFDALPRDIDFDYRVTIAGDGPLKRALKKRVEKDSFLQKHIVFMGKIPFFEMQESYERCIAVVLPSLSEATGTVVIEGLSCGKPIIAANHFGAKLFVGDDAGWLFDGSDKKDLVDSFNRCLRECLIDSELRKKKANNAIRVASKYSWENRVKRFNNLYERLKKRETN